MHPIPLAQITVGYVPKHVGCILIPWTKPKLQARDTTSHLLLKGSNSWNFENFAASTFCPPTCLTSVCFLCVFWCTKVFSHWIIISEKKSDLWPFPLSKPYEVKLGAWVALASVCLFSDPTQNPYAKDDTVVTRLNCGWYSLRLKKQIHPQTFPEADTTKWSASLGWLQLENANLDYITCINM